MRNAAANFSLSPEKRMCELINELQPALFLTFKEPVPTILKGSAASPTLPIVYQKCVLHNVVDDQNVVNELLPGGPLVKHLYLQPATDSLTTFTYYATDMYFSFYKHTGAKRT